MDQKDLAFVFLSLIIVYSAAFKCVVDAIEEKETNENHNHNNNNNNNDIENNSIHSALFGSRPSSPMAVVHNLLANLPNSIHQQVKHHKSQPPASSPRLSIINDNNNNNDKYQSQIRIQNSNNNNDNDSDNDNDNVLNEQNYEYHNDDIKINLLNTNMDNANDNCDDEQLELIQPHKPKRYTISAVKDKHDIVELYQLNPTNIPSPSSSPSTSTLSYDISGHQPTNDNNDIPSYVPTDINSIDSIINDANLLISTVDGKFSVLSAENGKKRMDIDSIKQPLFYSESSSRYLSIVPGVDGQLFLLHLNDNNEEYLEPLPLSILQYTQFVGDTDPHGWIIEVDQKQNPFWINTDEWSVCNIKKMNNASSDIPACNNTKSINNLLKVTRVDYTISAEEWVGELVWKFKYGQYRSTTQHPSFYIPNDYTQNELNRYILFQSLDESSKYSAFLYDSLRGEIIWNKSLSSLITHISILTKDHYILPFIVQHTKLTNVNYDSSAGLWLLPEDKYTQVAIASHQHSSGLISSHMYLPDASSSVSSSSSDIAYDDDYIDNDNMYIFDEDTSLEDMLQYNRDQIAKERQQHKSNNKPIRKQKPGSMATNKKFRNRNKNRNSIRFVPLSFDGDFDGDPVSMPTPSRIDSNGYWLSSDLFYNFNPQKYAKQHILKIFDPRGITGMRPALPQPNDVKYVNVHDKYYIGDPHGAQSFYVQNIFSACLGFIVFLLCWKAPNIANNALNDNQAVINNDIVVDNVDNDHINNQKRKPNTHQDLATIDNTLMVGLENEMKQQGIPIGDNKSRMMRIGSMTYDLDRKLGRGRQGDVYAGTFSGRPCAIKRLLRDKSVDDKVINEINILIKVDRHPNIVRYHAKEIDCNFIYIALELCLCSLYDVINRQTNDINYAGRRTPKISHIYKPIISNEIPIKSLSISGEHPSFCSCDKCRDINKINRKKSWHNHKNKSKWNNKQFINKKHLINTSKNWRKSLTSNTIANNDPNDINMNKPAINNTFLHRKQLKKRKFIDSSVKNICRDMMSGIVQLHSVQIVHRDIKPQNILISDDNRCKIADMGLAKIMQPGRTSFDSDNCGTLFWNAPEFIFCKSMSSLKSNNQNNSFFKDDANNNDITPIKEENDDDIQKEEEEKKEKKDNDNQITNNIGLSSLTGLTSPLLTSIFGKDKEIVSRSLFLTNDHDIIPPSDINDDDDAVSDIDNDNDDDDNELEESISYSSSYSTVSDKIILYDKPRLTFAVDIFSLGCVYSYILSRGKHPYGSSILSQEKNMEAMKPSLLYCQHTIPEAYDLIISMINVNPIKRPTALECSNHPFFWNNKKILQFLMEFSDYIEKCNKSHILRVTLELSSLKLIGRDWGMFVDAELLSDAGKHRKYNFSSVRDYLRIIRNKWNHFNELPINIQNKLKDNNNNIKSESKFIYYFTQYTPQLLMYCYKLIASAFYDININNNNIYNYNHNKIKSFNRYYKHISLYRLERYHKQIRIKFRRWYNKD